MSKVLPSDGCWKRTIEDAMSGECFTYFAVKTRRSGCSMCFNLLLASSQSHFLVQLCQGQQSVEMGEDLKKINEGEGGKSVGLLRVHWPTSKHYRIRYMGFRCSYF